VAHAHVIDVDDDDAVVIGETELVQEWIDGHGSPWGNYERRMTNSERALNSSFVVRR
jgi:hypothetical protein